MSSRPAHNFRPLRAHELPDPTEWPLIPGLLRRFWVVVAAAVIAGFLSAALVGYVFGAWQLAALFTAVVIASAVVGYFTALGRAKRGGGRIDWALVRAALESQSVALAITDAEDRLVSANAAYGARAGGFPAPFELAAEADRRDALITAAAAARRDGNGFADIELTGEDGQSRRLRITVRPAEQGREYLLWTLRRDRVDKAVDDLREMVEGAFGNWLGRAEMAAAVAGKDGHVLAANSQFYNAIGRQPEAVALNLGNLVDLDDDGDAWLLANAGSGHAERRPVSFDRFALGDGDPEHAVAYLFLIKSRAPRRPSVAAETPESLPALLGVLPIGLALADSHGKLVLTNDAFMHAAGIDDDDAPLYPSDLVEQEDKAVVADMVRRAAGGLGGLRDLRVRLKHRPEEPVILTIGRAPWESEATVVLSLKDNREQLKLEKQITQATKMQAVGQLAGGVAHDFNNILTAVLGYCDLMMMRHSPGDPDFDDINQIRQNANRAANLVRQLLAFSRQQTLRPQLIQVSDVIAELSHLLKRLLGERITLKVEHGRNLAPVRADPGQMEQVIVNLAVNARDAMEEGGELTISTFAVSPHDVRRLKREEMPAADYVAIAVKDTGHGIPASEIGKIFEPFFTTKEVGRGTGLGLSTVYGIVKQSGGFIFADSKAAEGTVFTIYLPEQEAPVSAETKARARGDEEPSWGEGRILIAEDEHMVRAVAERALARNGYEVQTAENGEVALELLEGMGEEPDLLITDVVMPVMDGPTLVEHARELFPDLKIIFMSGYAEEQLRKSITIDSVEFLAKPFSVADITEKVRATLED